MGKTLTEKVFSEHTGRGVRAGEFVVSKVDIQLVQDSTGPLAVCQIEKLKAVSYTHLTLPTTPYV